MSQKVIVTSQRAPAAIGPYSQAVVAQGLVYTSGVIPLDPETKAIAGTDIRTQTERVLKSLAGLLEDAGSSMANAVKTTCFLQDLSEFPAFNDVYTSHFNGDQPPARSTVEVSRLPMGVLVEVECIALLNDGQ